jgi:hypothetical protein
MRAGGGGASDSPLGRRGSTKEDHTSPPRHGYLYLEAKEKKNEAKKTATVEMPNGHFDSGSL